MFALFPHRGAPATRSRTSQCSRRIRRIKPSKNRPIASRTVRHEREESVLWRTELLKHNSAATRQRSRESAFAREQCVPSRTERLRVPHNSEDFQCQISSSRSFIFAITVESYRSPAISTGPPPTQAAGAASFAFLAKGGYGDACARVVLTLRHIAKRNFAVTFSCFTTLLRSACRADWSIARNHSRAGR